MLDLVVKQNLHSVDDTITIYPFKDVTKLEFQEKVLKLALKSILPGTSNSSESSNFLFVSSVHVDNDYNCLSLIIEQFDKSPTKPSSAQLPDSIYIPSRFVAQKNLTLDESSSSDEAPTTTDHYFNAVKYLHNYFQKFCSNIESLSKVVSMSSTIHYKSNITQNAHVLLLNVTFDLITLANCFDAHRIHPISIIETSLLKTLQTMSSFYVKPKTGYCALYKNEHVLLLMDSDKANKMGLMGVWVSGTLSVNHPVVWAACIRYAFSNLVTNKSSEFVNSFVVILFPSLSRRAEYYVCRPVHSKLEFTLFNGFNKLLVNKLNNENRCISIDLNEIKDGYRYKLFTNSVNQAFRQEIFGHHQQLNSIQQQQQHTDPDNTFSSIKSANSDLEPRSLSASQTTAETIQIIPQPYKINSTIQLSPQLKPTIVVGSYHSVSDISVLSDNGDDESNSAYFSNQMTNRMQSKNKQLSQSDDFEFLRPKDPLLYQAHVCHQQQQQQQQKSPLSSASTSRLNEKQQKYNQNLYSSNNSLSSSLSSSYSPLPSFNNSLSQSQSHPQQQQQQQQTMKPLVLLHEKTTSLNKNSQAYENSKSMLFGIPRDSPMPTPIAATTLDSSDFQNSRMIHLDPHSLDSSPFADITCVDDISLYRQEATSALPAQPEKTHLLTQQQQQQQQQSFHLNPAYLSSSMLSSSTSSSSNNNSHHSSTGSSSSSTNNFAYATSYPNLNNSYGNNSHQYNSYNNNNSNNNNNRTQPAPPQQQQDFYGKDDQFTDQAFRMQQMQEQINSLNLMQRSPAGLAGDTYQNQHQMLASSSSGAVLEERKQLLKPNYTNTNSNHVNNTAVQHSQQQQPFQSLQSTNNQKPNSCQTRVNNNNIQQYHHHHQQQQQQPHNVYKEDLFSLSTNSLKSLNQVQNTNQLASNSLNDLRHQHQQQQQQQPKHYPAYHSNEASSSQNSLNSSHKKFTNLVPVSSEDFQLQLRMSKDPESESEDEDEYEDDHDERSECENVFGTALKDLKQNKHNWQQSNSDHSTFIESTKKKASSEATDLPKFNYVSLLLTDDYCDKNTSLNTEALAYKYLNTNSQQQQCVSQTFNSNCSSNSTNMTYYNPSSNPQFQFYHSNSVYLSGATSMLAVGPFEAAAAATNSTPQTQRINVLNSNHKMNADLLPSQIIEESSTVVKSLALELTHEVFSNESAGENDETSSSDPDDDADENGEVWLFGKPKNAPVAHNKFLDKPDTRSLKNQIYKPPLPTHATTQKRKKLQSQQKRSSTGTALNKQGKPKDFSDQDEEVDRDVTTVLDIEKLKRLPKLL